MSEMEKLHNDPRRTDELREDSTSKSPFLLAISCVVALFWLVTISVIASDPLDLYSWGKPPKMLPDYPMRSANHLYAAVSRKQVDALMISASTLAAVQRADLEQAFPEFGEMFNFSVSGPRPFDRHRLLTLVAKQSPAQHIFISFDWIYALPSTRTTTRWPRHLYDESKINDLRIASPTVLMLTTKHLRNQPLTEGEMTYEDQMENHKRSFIKFQSKESMDYLRKYYTFPEFSPDNSASGCENFTAITDQLVPVLKKLSAQGKRTDIISPPYSLATYGLSMYRMGIVGTASFLETQIEMRRCLVNQIEGLANVRVFAFDNENWITADLANYFDPAHFYDRGIKGYILKSVREGNHQLTSMNFDHYARQLVAATSTYEIYNSNF